MADWRHQDIAVEDLYSVASKGHRKILLVGPTGSGKTNIYAKLIDRAWMKHSYVLLLAPRRELIYQASERIEHIPHGIIMSGEDMFHAATVNIASFDTLFSRAVRKRKIMMPRADLLIVDEAHLSLARTRQHLIRYYPEALLIGGTATPCQGNGKGLGKYYDSMVIAGTTAEMIAKGILVQPIYYAPTIPDLKKITKFDKDGDYDEDQLAELMDQPKLVGDVLTNWRRIASDRKTVIYAVNRAHGRHICQRFVSDGIRAEYLDGDTPNGERKRILARISTGETQVLVNVYVATYGLDIPSLSCASLVRPTKSLRMYIQMGGRIIRSDEGKHDAILIDHAGAIEEHGYLEDDVPWNLDSKSSVHQSKRRQAEERGQSREIICSQCGNSFRGRRKCPVCDYEIIPPGADIPTHKADLQVHSRKQKKAEPSEQEMLSWFGQLKTYCMERGKDPGFAVHTFIAKFKRSPGAEYDDIDPLPIGKEVQGFITHRNIRYANRRR